MTAIDVAATASTAQSRADRIRAGVRSVMEWQQEVLAAWNGRDWEALGYQSWDAYLSGEFGEHRVSLLPAQRREFVASMRAAGDMSTRAIASAANVSQMTVVRDLRPPAETNVSPDLAGFEVDYGTGETRGPQPDDDHVLTEAECEALDEATEPAPKVTGIDGKSYPKQAPRATPRKPPLVELAKTRGFALRDAMDGVLKVIQEPRYRTNEKQVADALRGHLLYVAETVAAVLDQLP